MKEGRGKEGTEERVRERREGGKGESEGKERGRERREGGKGGKGEGLHIYSIEKLIGHYFTFFFYWQQTSQLFTCRVRDLSTATELLAG